MVKSKFIETLCLIFIVILAVIIFCGSLYLSAKIANSIIKGGNWLTAWENIGRTIGYLILIAGCLVVSFFATKILIVNIKQGIDKSLELGLTKIREKEAEEEEKEGQKRKQEFMDYINKSNEEELKRLKTLKDQE